MALSRRTENAINPSHHWIRLGIRSVGICVLLAGLILSAYGLFDFLSAFGNFGQPRRPWLLFVGLILIPIGFALCAMGFMGAVLRYQAQEVAPVGVDTINYAGPRAREGVTAIAEAIGEGIAEGRRRDAGRCPVCGAEHSDDARFCDQCAAPLGVLCPSCSHRNEADAKFCSNCRSQLTGGV